MLFGFIIGARTALRRFARSRERRSSGARATGEQAALSAPRSESGAQGQSRVSRSSPGKEEKRIGHVIRSEDSCFFTSELPSTTEYLMSAFLLLPAAQPAMKFDLGLSTLLISRFTPVPASPRAREERSIT